MRLQYYIYLCDQCKKKFKEPELPDQAYGEFLLRSSSGEIRYLNALGSKEFAEVSGFVFEYLVNADISDWGRVDILHIVFSKACDLSSDGSEYEIKADPICPNCHSNKMHSRTPTYPIICPKVGIPHVTHEKWNQLSAEEKKARTIEAVDKILLDMEKYGIR